MFKKQDPWQSGMKIVSRLFGFDDDDQYQYQKPQPEANRHTIHTSNGFLPSRMPSQMPIAATNKQHSANIKSTPVRQKWKKLMAKPAYKCRHEIIRLLLEEASPGIQDQTWMWLMRNSQKITSQLYNLKKEKFNSIAYSNSVRMLEFQMGPIYEAQNIQIQIQDFTQYPEFNRIPSSKDSEIQNSTADNLNLKKKFSITKGATLKVPSTCQQVTGRSSIHSQASTFSSQTHNSNQFHQNQQSLKRNNQSPFIRNQHPTLDNNFHLDLPTTQRYSSPSIASSSYNLPLPLGSALGSPMGYSNQNSARSSVSNYSSSHPNSELIPQTQKQRETYFGGQLENSELHALTSTLQNLPSIVPHKSLCDVIGSFLLHRQDISYSVTLFNIAATFYFYTNSNELKTFILLNHFVTTEVYLPYLTAQVNVNNLLIKDNSYLTVESMLGHIASRIRAGCPSAVFLKRFKLQTFIETWLYSFFYSVCENGTEIKQKVFSYLLVGSFSLDSVAKFCEALVHSMSRIINQGIDEKTYECLQNPKFYLDKQILLQHLLSQ